MLRNQILQKILILLTLTILSSQLNAQSAQLKWGTDLDNGTAIPNVILGESKNNVYVISLKGDNLYLQRFDSESLTLQVDKKIDLERIEKTSQDIEMFVLIREEVIVYTSIYTGKTRKLFYITYNKDIVALHEPKQIFEIPVASKATSTDFKFHISDDGTHFGAAVYAEFPSEKKKKFISKIFDFENKEVNSSELEFPILKNSKTVYNINKFCTDNDGNIHVLTSLFTEFYNKKYHYSELQIYTKSKIDKKEYKEAVTANKNVYLGSIKMEVDKQGDLCIFGLYSESVPIPQSEIFMSQGTMFIKVDGASHQLKTKAFNIFSKEQKVKLFGEKSAGTKNIGLMNVSIDHLIFKEDGTFTFIGESFYGTANLQYYNYIYVLNFSTEGNVIWTATINKAQSDLGATLALAYSYGMVMVDRNHFFSYLVGEKDGKICIIYNDNKKNIGKKMEETFAPLTAPGKGVPVIVSITEKGEISERKAIDGKDEDDVKIRPVVSKQVSANSIIVYGSKKSKNKLGRVLFE